MNEADTVPHEVIDKSKITDHLRPAIFKYNDDDPRFIESLKGLATGEPPWGDRPTAKWLFGDNPYSLQDQTEIGYRTIGYEGIKAELRAKGVRKDTLRFKNVEFTDENGVEHLHIFDYTDDGGRLYRVRLETISPDGDYETRHYLFTIPENQPSKVCAMLFNHEVGNINTRAQRQLIKGWSSGLPPTYIFDRS